MSPVRQMLDCFGLRPPLIAESEDDTRSRVALVKKGVADAFAAAVRHLGDEEARELFASVARRRKRGKGKSLASDRDTQLLAALESAQRIGETIPALAKRLHVERKRELGNSPEAIETQIRKLLKERSAKKRTAELEAQRWRQMSPPSPTIVSRVLDKK